MCEKALKVEFICGVTMSNRHSKTSFNSKKPQVNGPPSEQSTKNTVDNQTTHDQT
ncbi:unnamed protein product [Brassica oleracea]